MNGLHFKGIGNTKFTPIDYCGKIWGFMLETEQGFLAEPKKTEPTKGEHDFNTCANCQNTRKELIKKLTEKFNGKGLKQGFPFCCPYHSNLTKVKEFNRVSFVSVPELVADKIIYTNQHIINNCENENYYKYITDYIDYTVESFGLMPKGCGEPLYLSAYFLYVTDLFTQNTKISTERKNRILEFLEAHQTPTTKNTNTDLNILLGTYQKWLKEFPFEISFFTNLKPYFEKQLPILNGKPEVNKYTGIAKAKMHTKASLIDVLLNLTNSLLTQINSVSLYEKGLLTEPQKIKMELVLNERKLKLKKGYVNNSQNEEQRYRKILKEWFADEKRFIDEITPLLKALPPQQVDTRFWLTSTFMEQEQTKHEYKSFQRQIENKGYFIVKTETDTIKIYTPELMVIFASEELPARNMDTQKETTINGGEYLKTYIAGYKEGEQYFENEFKVSPDTLYGANAEQYVKDIHSNFFHVQHTAIIKGWVSIKKQFPIILTHEAVKEFGYYSGIVNKVEEQVKKYPRLFAAFDKCKHNLPPQQTEAKTEQGTPNFINNFDNIKPLEIYKHFKTGLVEKGYLTEPELNEYLKSAFELQTIPKTLFRLKHTPTKQDIYTVFYVYYKDISGKKHEQQTRYAELLGSYFEGYKTKIIRTNWARDYMVKR